MNFATAFYLSSQTPAQLSGPSLAMLLLLSGLITETISVKRKGEWLSTLDYHKLFITVASAIILAIIQNIYLPYTLNPLTAAHLSIYIAIYIASDKHKYLPTQTWAIRLTTISNALILAASILPPIQDAAFVDKAGGLRFQSYFSEPSVAAFIYIFNIAQILEHHKSDPWRKALITLNVVCLIFTYSGSGLVLAALILLTHYAKNFSTSTTLKLAGIAFLVATLGGTVLAEQVNQLLVSRIQAIIDSQADNSTFLRFVAPWLFIEDLFSNGNHAWTGTGVGGLVPYIEQNQAKLWYLVDFEGTTVYNINNGYAAIIAMLGAPVGGSIIALFFLYLRNSEGSVTSKLLVVSYPFFSGYVIHPLLWLLIANAGIKDNEKVH